MSAVSERRGRPVFDVVPIRRLDGQGTWMRRVSASWCPLDTSGTSWNGSRTVRRVVLPIGAPGLARSRMTRTRSAPGPVTDIEMSLWLVPAPPFGRFADAACHLETRDAASVPRATSAGGDGSADLHHRAHPSRQAQ